MAKFLTGVLKLSARTNLMAVVLFTMRLAEDLVVNIISSRAKKLYLKSNLRLLMLKIS